MSKTCVLDSTQNRRGSNSLPLTPFQVAINGDRMEWSFGGTAGDSAFTAPTMPFGDVPPFPMPTYEVQSSLSTVILKGSETGIVDKKSATMHSRLTVRYHYLCLERMRMFTPACLSLIECMCSFVQGTECIPMYMYVCMCATVCIHMPQYPCSICMWLAVYGFASAAMHISIIVLLHSAYVTVCMTSCVHFPHARHKTVNNPRMCCVEHQAIHPLASVPI